MQAFGRLVGNFGFSLLSVAAIVSIKGHTDSYVYSAIIRKFVVYTIKYFIQKPRLHYSPFFMPSSLSRRLIFQIEQASPTVNSRVISCFGNKVPFRHH